MQQVVLIKPLLRLFNLQQNSDEFIVDNFSLLLIFLVFIISSFGIIFYIRFRENEKINRRLEEEILIKQKSEKALKISESKFREANATKDKFFSILSHELKSPFAAIMGMAELMEKEYHRLKARDRVLLVKELGNATRNTYGLLQELLIWSKSQRGLLDFNPSAANLRELCQESIDIVGAAALNKSIWINCLVDPKIFIDVDNNMLSTILRNLLTNAIKFTHQKGTVEIQAKKIATQNKGGISIPMISVSIKDSGIGISPKNIDKLLKIDDIYKRYGTENESGTGLGLIICKEFVVKHGGKISIESEVDRGSSFSFTIPVAANPSEK